MPISTWTFTHHLQEYLRGHSSHPQHVVADWPRNSFTAYEAWPWTYIHGTHSSPCSSSPGELEGRSTDDFLVYQFSTSWTRWSSRLHLSDLIFLDAVVSAVTQGPSGINEFLFFFLEPQDSESWNKCLNWTAVYIFKMKIVSNRNTYNEILCSASRPFKLWL